MFRYFFCNIWYIYPNRYVIYYRTRLDYGFYLMWIFNINKKVKEDIMEDNNIVDDLIDVVEGLDVITAIGYFEAAKIVLVQFAQMQVDEDESGYTN